MSDIVARLRALAHFQTMTNEMNREQALAWLAADEIERLRAVVEASREVLRLENDEDDCVGADGKLDIDRMAERQREYDKAVERWVAAVRALDGKPCPTCGGDGTVQYVQTTRETDGAGNDLGTLSTNCCPTCNGDGTLDGEP